jgi:hypothetical protein
MRDGQSSQGLASRNTSLASVAAMRARLRSGEITERKQVGDTESMMNEEPSIMQPGGGNEWLE